MQSYILLADLIKRLEEENKVNAYLCQEKLPKVMVSHRSAKEKHCNCFFLSIVIFWILSKVIKVLT